MRILTVRQPWAWAVIHEGKNVENRVRNIAGSYRGPVAIHVAGKYAEDGLDLDVLAVAMEDYCATRCDGNPNHHPWLRHVGKIIGVVDLVDVHQVSQCGTWAEVEPRSFTWTQLCSPWAGLCTHHLVLTNPRPLATPIPYRGALGLRRLDADTITRIEGGLQ